MFVKFFFYISFSSEIYNILISFLLWFLVQFYQRHEFKDNLLFYCRKLFLNKHICFRFTLAEIPKRKYCTSLFCRNVKHWQFCAATLLHVLFVKRVQLMVLESIHCIILTSFQLHKNRNNGQFLQVLIRTFISLMIQIDSKAKEGPVLLYNKRQDRLWREGEDILFYFHDKGRLNRSDPLSVRVWTQRLIF